jgi:deoxyuridine 5'-triphosphate nucleotidohydrolase
MAELKYFSAFGYELKPEKSGSANVDIQCGEDFELEQGIVLKVRTGLWVDVPPGYVFEIYPRSGHAAKYGMILVNSPGQIDPGYRDEIRLILTSVSRMTVLTPKRFKAGERICQGRIVATTNAPVQSSLFPNFGPDYLGYKSIESLYKDSETPDRKGGLGSSGTQ